jgi:hypothetical protein
VARTTRFPVQRAIKTVGRRSSSCQTTRRPHPLQTPIDVATLAPNAEITVFPWREPPELKARTIQRVRRFLKAHVSNSALRRYPPAAK